MPRYIDANVLKADHFVASTTANTTNYLYVSLSQIENAPTADVRENVHAHWTCKQLGGWHCSECGEQAPFWCMASTQNLANFCPNCGAVMDERREENDEVH